MRILFYINQIAGGGAERVMSQLANRFSEEGNTVMLVTSFRVEQEYKLVKSIKRKSIENEEVVQSRLMRNISRIKKLRDYCNCFKPDVVVSFMQEPNARLLLATIGMNCRKVVSVRNDPRQEYKGILGMFVGKAMIPLLADCCIFQTKEASQWFPKKLRRKSQVIPNQVSDEFFRTDLSGKKEYWVAVGRLVEQKNYIMMIKAFNEVIEKNPDEQLRIYGTGPLNGFLQEEIEKRGLSKSVHLCGRTDDVPSVLSDAKGFLMTSDYEGMPNALMEALAMGLPCISTDCPSGGPKELIDNGVNGILVPTNNHKKMASKINYLINEKGIAKMIGLNAKEYAKSYDSVSVFNSWKKALIQ